MTTAIAFAIGMAASVQAHAAGVPAGTVVRIGRAIDTAAFARAVDRQFHVQLRRVVATDIDRDGDLDIVASTDRGFIVWVNDGAGRLTSQSPKHAPTVDGTAPAGEWRGGGSRRDLTVQNDAPSSRIEIEDALAPPPTVTRHAVRQDRRLHADAARGARTPRAPPSPIV
ncbi:MAG: VCBS repeat-containing protein [Acidobacteria bacterium]|nr:VCBS repeat-containing protein [Acidobacteriota bacterium]